MLSDTATLASFFSGKTVFLTGATGSVGLLVTEKLLRTTNVKRIYALVRATDRKAAQSRLEACWDKYLPFCANTMKSARRVVALPGDISMPMMGLAYPDQKLVRQEASIVIHLASDIALLKSVSEIAQANLFGLLELAQFATSFRRMERFVYVSSFFSQIHRTHVDEELVPWSTTEQELEQIKQGRDPFPIEEVFFINYLYSKHLAERILQARFPHLPIMILRPSCIGPSYAEPVPQWTYVASMPVNNYHRMALKKPKDQAMVHKTLEHPSDGSNLFDEVPIDYVVSCLLAHTAAGTLGPINANAGFLNPMPASAQFKHTEDLLPPQHFANIPREQTRGPCRIFKLTGMPCPVGTNEKTLRLRDAMTARNREDFSLDLEKWDMDKWQQARARTIRAMAEGLQRKGALAKLSGPSSQRALTALSPRMALRAKL